MSAGVYELPPEFSQLRDAMRGIVADRVAPRTAEIDASGEYPGESETGSDRRSTRTHAVRDGGEWSISGAKNWTSNASIAEFYVVFAMTDSETRRSTAFIVEADRPGFAVQHLVIGRAVAR